MSVGMHSQGPFPFSGQAGYINGTTLAQHMLPLLLMEALILLLSDPALTAIHRGYQNLGFLYGLQNCE